MTSLDLYDWARDLSSLLHSNDFIAIYLLSNDELSSYEISSLRSIQFLVSENRIPNIRSWREFQLSEINYFFF